MNIEKFNPWNWFKHEEGSWRSEGRFPAMQGGGSSLLKRFDDGHPLSSLHREMDRIFDNAFENFGFPSTRASNLFGESQINGFQTKIDVAGDASRYKISLDVPGMSESDLSIDVSGDVLTISGKKEDKKEEKDKHFYRMERSYGSFQRTLALPSDAIADEIEAKLDSGVLSVRIPRRELPAGARKHIEVTS